MRQRLIITACFVSAALASSGCQMTQQSELVLEAPPQAESPAWLPAHAAQVSRMDANTLQASLSRISKARKTSPNDLRLQCEYALLLGQWGHAQYAPGTAADLLDAAGNRMAEAGWSEADRHFAEYQSAQLRYIAARAALLKGSRQESASLRTRLIDAEAKLRAIADIEKELNEETALD